MRKDLYNQRWKVGIINGLARNQSGRRFSNAIAENNNSHIQRVINVAYGYRNFERFRRRIMLILAYKNQR
ncbi:MAG: transposase [Clostridia bacterium]|nr:transposase [Bacilli bacterium]MBR3674472.1 transposase [Clostridia bacterium]